MNSEILVIIVTFNGMAWLERCIESILRQSEPCDIFVVDNGSTDGTVEWLRKRSIPVIAGESNIGFGAANNLGLRHALEQGYSYVYLLNQDAWLENDTLERLVHAFEQPGYGILSPVQNDATGHKMDARFARRCKKYLRAHKGEEVVEVPFVMAAHWMISRGCLMAVGGVSPAFKLYGEDDNYIDRARWMGYRVGVVPGAAAVHDRAQRKESKERRMFLKCNASTIHVSNPSKGLLLRLLWEPLRLAGISLLHLDKEPLRFAGRLIKRYPELIRYRKQSRRKGAFLMDEKKSKRR